MSGVLVPLALPSDDPRPILEAMGLDVRKGFLDPIEHVVYLAGHNGLSTRGSDVLVVRPRGEATDA